MGLKQNQENRQPLSPRLNQFFINSQAPKNMGQQVQDKRPPFITSFEYRKFLEKQKKLLKLHENRNKSNTNLNDINRKISHTNINMQRPQTSNSTNKPSNQFN